MKKIGKYEITKLLGSGGMGEVYEGHDPILERKVAIKLILEGVMNIPEIKERFYREARSAGGLNHENITTIHEINEEDGKPYIVMEYLEGNDLESILNRKEPLTVNQILNYAKQICTGLQHAHKKMIIHRDIKPANIRILDDGRVKILDFGLAKPEPGSIAAANAVYKTQANVRIGTPWYMSPEQIGEKKVDKRTDIFSFGVLLYEMVANKKPFAGDYTTVQYKIMHTEPEKIQQIHHLFVEELEDVIMKCLKKEPDQRYSDFSEITNHLNTISAKAKSKSTISKLIEEGRTFLAENKYDKALSKLDEVLTINPGNVDAVILKHECTESAKKVNSLIADGKSYLKNGEYNDALQSFQTALSLDKNNKEIIELINKCQRKLKDRQRIEDLLKTTGKLVNKRRYNEAMTSLKQILAISPDNPEAKELKQQITKKIAQTEHVAKLLDKAKKYIQRQKYMMAIETYNEVIEIESDNQIAIKGLKEAEKSLKFIQKHADQQTILHSVSEKKSPSKNIMIALAGIVVVAVFAGILLFRQGSENIESGISDSGNISTEIVSIEIEQARQEMLKSKSAAQQIGADSLAGSTFKSALQLEAQGSSEFNEAAYQSAVHSFQEADKAFNMSIEETHLNLLMIEVASTRKKMLARKATAKRLNSPKLARNLFADALTKEREADSNAAQKNQNSLSIALQAYREADEAFIRAGDKAKQMAENKRESEWQEIRNLKATAEAVQKLMISDKILVPGAQSVRENNTNYLKAVDLESEADRYFTSGNFTSASESYMTAKEYFRKATDDINSFLINQANAAMQSMRAEKLKIKQANRSVPKYQTALGIEADAKKAYNNKKYELAAERYQTAQDLYNEVFVDEKTKIPSHEEIQAFINRYQQLFEDKDLDALKTLLNYTAEEIEIWQKFFSRVDNLSVDTYSKINQISGTNKSEAELLIQISYYNKTKNRTETNELSIKWTFGKDEGKLQLLSRK